MQKYADVVTDRKGNVVPGALVRVMTQAGADAVLYSANNGADPISNPVITDNLGGFAFYAANGRYNLEIYLDEVPLATLNDVLLEDPQDASPEVIEGGTFRNGALENVTIDGQVPVTQADLADPIDGPELLGFIRGPFGQSQQTVGGMLSAQTLNVWEGMVAIPEVDKTDIADPSTWYWDAAINLVMQQGKKVLVTEMFKIRNKLSSKVSGTQLVGGGIDAAGLVLDQLGSPGASFAGSCAVELGDSSVAAVNTRHLGISDLYINMGGRDIPAVAILGARDGSYAKRVYIQNFSATAFRTNMSGDGVGVAAGKMCEGMIIEQVIAFPQHGITTDVFLLDGIFESKLNGCKAFGYTLAENNAVGFAVGKNSEARAVKLDTCSAANMVKFGNAANHNLAITYGQWAKSCWDYNTTLENVEGSGVEFHGGTASGQMLPFDCVSVSPRPYFSANLDVLNPLYKFRACNACHALEVNHFSTVKATFQFTAENGFNNFGTFDINAEPADVAGVIVVFDPGCLTSNFVKGHASGVNLRKEMTLTPDQQFYQVLPNGAYIQTDASWTSINAGITDKVRVRNALLEAMFEFDGANNRNRAIKPFHPLGGQLTTTQSVTGSGGAAQYTPTMTNAEFHDVTFSNATAFTVNAPTSLIKTARLMLKVTNGNGATGITPVFNAAYKGAPSAALPAGKVAYYEFVAVSPTSLAYVNHVIDV